MADVLDQIDQTEDTQDLVFNDQQTDDAPELPDDSAQKLDAAPEDKIDGRKFNPEWSKALKELRESRPELADMLTKLRDTYGRYGAISELAPKGVEDIRSWKTTIDAIGGPEAAADLMERTAQIEQIDSRIAAADFSVVGELPEDMQQGFYKMLPDALTHLSQTDDRAFAAIVQPHFSAALAATGMEQHLRTMYAKAEGNPEVQELIKQQFDWLQNQVKGAGTMPSGTKTVDPKVAELQAKLDSYSQKDVDNFTKGVTETTTAHMAKSFTDNASVYIKQKNLSEMQQSDLRESYDAKLVAVLSADKAFQKQLQAYGALNKSGKADSATVANFVQAKIDEVSKKIVDDLVVARYGNVRTMRQPPVAGATPTSGGAVRVAQAPDQSKWDMDKMTALGYENTVKKGLFHLADGRTVQLQKAN
jgi:hypothetical protein